MATLVDGLSSMFSNSKIDLGALGAGFLGYLGTTQSTKANIAAQERANAANINLANATNSYQAMLDKQNLAIEQAKLNSDYLTQKNTMAQDDQMANAVNGFFNSKSDGSNTTLGGLSQAYKTDYNSAGDYEKSMQSFLSQIDPSKLVYTPTTIK